MPEDIPSRIEIMRLKRLVQALSMSLSYLSANVAHLLLRANIFVVEDTADLSVRDAHGASAIMMKSNDSEDFGIYFPTNTGTVDGSSIVADVNGNKFELFQ